MKFSRLGVLATAMLCVAGEALAHPPAEAIATYIANEGVLVADDETKVLFDPLFQNSYGNYRTPSDEQRAAMLAGDPPFDGVDAIFISHAHGDHFTAEDVNEYLAAQSDVILVAPAQAVAMMKSAANWDDVLAPRVGGTKLAFGDDAATMSFGALEITAVRIPHAGWPNRADVENLVYRVTLNDGATIMHLGDADPDDDHYAPYDDVWDADETDLAFPPYWFLTDENGRAILMDRLHAKKSVGVHVPYKMPVGLQDARDDHGADYFYLPGETRAIPHKHGE